jgi:hypothetical protein
LGARPGGPLHWSFRLSTSAYLDLTGLTLLLAMFGGARFGRLTSTC